MTYVTLIASGSISSGNRISIDDRRRIETAIALKVPRLSREEHDASIEQYQKSARLYRGSSTSLTDPRHDLCAGARSRSLPGRARSIAGRWSVVHAKPLRRGQGQAPLLDLGQDAHHHKQLGALRWFQVKPVVKEPVAERIGVAAAGRAAAACVAHCHLATFDQRVADQHPIIVVRARLPSWRGGITAQGSGVILSQLNGHRRAAPA